MERTAGRAGSLLCLLVGAASVLVYLGTPQHSAVQLGVWFVPFLMGVGVTVARCRGASGPVLRSLLLLLAAQVAYLLLLAAWYLGPVVLGWELPFPSLLDLGFLLTYAVFAAFLVSVLRTGAVGSDVEARAAVIDALILTTALSALLWVGVVVPNLQSGASDLATAVALLYPAFNLVLCGLGAPLVLDRLASTGFAGLLLLTWLAMQIAGDVVYGIQSAAGTFAYGTPLFVTWMIAYTCLAAMVAHPALPALLDGQVGQQAAPHPHRWHLSRSVARKVRLVVLYVAATVPLLVQGLSERRSVVLLLMAAVGFGLVIWRLALVAGDLREQRRLAAELEVKGEELLEANEELRRAGEARSVFLATMSHEIRTPLNAIIGMSGIVLDSRLTPEQAEQLEIVRGAGESLLSLVNDILDFSKIDAGRIDLEAVPFVLLDCVESAVDLVAPQAAAKGLELLHTVAPDCPDVVLGDLTRVRQVLVNLLTNAVKFTAEGEVLLEVTLETASGHLHFEVHDTGVGIPADRMERIFDSFTQADTSTTRSAGGTGLGLTISRQLAEAMGGRVWAESRDGKGSTFFFTAPLRPARRPAAAPPPRRGADELEGARVLVVDDNDTSRRLLSHQLEAWGMVPADVASPETALEWVHRGRPFDLAVLDVQMPEMDGVTLAGLLRTTQQGRRLPVVLLSSLGSRLEPSPDLSHVSRVAKPVKAGALAEALLEAVQGTAHAERPTTVEDRTSADLARLRILVAEDNVVNQKVALGVLERFGCRPDVASNGLETVEAVQRHRYDVVLMDVQMPEMDGLEATRRIRADLPADRQPYVVALTANALAEDRDRCLEAGMDAYLSKPLRAAQLLAILLGRPAAPIARPDLPDRRVGRPDRRAAAEDEPEDSDGSAAESSLDHSVLADLRADLDDDEFLREMIDRFVGSSADQVDQMEAVLRAGDRGRLRTQAHTLKGTAANFGAQRLMRLAAELQGVAETSDDERAAELVASLAMEVTATGEALKGYQVGIAG